MNQILRTNQNYFTQILLTIGILFGSLSVFSQYNVTSPLTCMPSPAGASTDHIFTSVTPPAAPGTVTLYYRGDIDLASEFISLFDENGVLIGQTIPSGDFADQCKATFDSITFPVSVAQLAAWTADGIVTFTSTPENTVNPTLCTPCGASYVNLTYQDVTGPDNIGIASIDAPANFCAGNEDVIVTVTNAGTNPVDTFTVSWTVDNGPVTSVLYDSISLDTFNGTNPSTVQLTLVNLNITAATDFKVWTSLPNNNPDTVNNNDTASTTFTPALAGTFTIDPAGSGATNFVDFASAIQSIRTAGLCGPVVFNVAPGIYNENIYLDQITGSSPTNSITFDGGSAATTTITYANTLDTPTVFLDGADFVTFTNLTIENTTQAGTATDAFGIYLTNQADFNTISSCTFNILETTSFDAVGIMASASRTSASAGNNANNLTIFDVNIPSSGRGIVLYGGTTSATHNLTNSIINCSITDFGSTGGGIYVDGQTELTIAGNTVRTSANINADGIYCFDVDQYFITENDVRVPDWGLYITDGNDGSNPGFQSLVVNNMFISDADYGMYLNDFEYTDVFHNSSSGNPAIRINDQANTINFVNNIFYSASDFAFESDDALSPTDSIDYNIYFSSGANAFDIGVSIYPDLLSWQLSDPTRNISSIEGDPVFVDPTSDLHINGILPNDVGNNAVGVVIDIDGDPRPFAGATIVDIGADEFAPPLCPQPSALATVAALDVSALVGWVEQGTATTWEVEFGPAGFAQGTGTVASTTNNPYNITGLMPQTSYDFYVRSICGAGDTSGWSGPSSFTTTCAVASAPFFDNLDGGGWVADNGGSSINSIIDQCWTRIPDVTTTYSWRVRTTSTGSGSGSTGPISDKSGSGNYIYTEASSGTSGSVAEIYTPFIDVTGIANPQVDYWYHFYGTQINIMYVDYFDGTSWSTVDSIAGGQQTAGTDPWLNKVIPLSPGTVIQIRFRAISDGCCAGDLAIDEVFVGAPPTCPAPQSVSAVVVGVDSAIITLSDSVNTTWEVEYGIAGFIPGTGTSFVTTDTTDTISGLLANTTYEVFVKAICGPGDTSLPAGPASFTTPCSVFSAPWADNLDGGTWVSDNSSSSINSQIDQCWERNPNNTTTYSWRVRTTSTGSGSTSTGPAADKSGTGNYAYTEASSGASGNVAILETPLVDISSLAIPQLKFWYHFYGTTINRMYIEVSDGSGWITLDSIVGQQQTSGTAAWLEDSVIIPVTGIVQARFRAISNGCCAGDLAIDEVSISDGPSCVPPVAISDSVITGDSVNIHFTDLSGATGWVYEYGITGFTPGTGTVDTAFTNPFGIGGLVTNATYDIYLRSICGASTSSWSGVYTFDVITCKRPTMLSALPLTANSVEFSWMENSGATQWEIEYGSAGFIPGTGTVIVTSNNPDTILGLASGASYDFFVRSTCGPSDTSLWSGPATVSLNYCSGGPSSTANSEVTNVLLNGSFGSISNLQTCPAAAGVQDFTAQSAGLVTGLTYTLNVTFGTCGGTFPGAGEAWIDWNQNLTFEPGESLGTWSGTGEPQGSTVFNGQFTFTVPSGTNIGATRMRVMQWEGGTIPLNPCGTFTWGSIEDYTILVDSVAPLCASVSGVLVNNLGADSAIVSWTDTSGTSTSWNIEYGVSGFILGSGTVVNTTSNPDTVGGLMPNSNYDFYVTAICGPGDSAFTVGPVTITTPCAVFAAPWSDNLDAGSWLADDVDFSAINSVIDQCWARDPDNTTSYSWRVRSTSTGSGSTGPDTDQSGSGNYAYIESSSGATGDAASLITPLVDISSLTIPQLKYWYHFYGLTIDRMYVEVNDGSGWVTIDSIIGQQQTSGADPWVQDSTIIPVTGIVQVRFRGIRGSSFTGDLAIDEVSITQGPSCVPPVSISDSVITGDSVNIHFIDLSGATAWIYEYGLTGFVPGTGTVDTATTNPFGIGGLVTNATYDVYIRSLCGGSVSSWSGAYTFSVINGPNPPFIGNDTTINSCAQLTLDAGAGYVSYLWSSGATTQTILVNASNLNPGTYNYSVTATDAGGFALSDTIAVTVLAGPNVDLGPDFGICTNETDTLDAGAGFTSYLWSDGSTAQTLPVDGAALGAGIFPYNVTVTDVNGCTDADTVFVQVFTPPTVSLGADTAICPSQTVTLDAGVFNSYLWQDGSTTRTYLVDGSVVGVGIGTYSVTVTNIQGCQGFDTVQVEVLNDLVVSLGADTSICYDDSITLAPGAYSSYVWQDGSTASTFGVSGASAGAGTGTYSVTVSDVNGCTGTDTVDVTVLNDFTVSIGGPDELCSYDLGTLSTVPANFAAYSWSTSETTATIDIDAANFAPGTGFVQCNRDGRQRMCCRFTRL
jgi:hypothetical protein